MAATFQYHYAQLQAAAFATLCSEVVQRYARMLAVIMAPDKVRGREGAYRHRFIACFQHAMMLLCRPQTAISALLTFLRYADARFEMARRDFRLTSSSKITSPVSSAL